jgi:outer membrane receptor protein involved in Fe transport
MRRLAVRLGLVALIFGAATAHATIFGNIRGIVHDPQHRPIEGATVTLRAQASDWTQAKQTDTDGAFEFSAVPVGEYRVTITHRGFAPSDELLVVESGSAPVLHFPLKLAGVTQEVKVSAESEQINLQSSTTENLVNREAIARTPGADRANSLAMITDYVPGAYIVHDQLHVRGGHQASWLIDGVPVPNTSIASNVGPQFNPKDIDYLEVQRGGYSAEYGDRTYGVFNVIPRSGFERNNEAELVASYGSFHQTNNQISLGSHTERFAYFGSISANRSDLGLESPTPAVLHALESGVGGFLSLFYNADTNNQLRLVTSLRHDHYQIPNTPDDELAGIRDLDRESDSFVNVSWVRTLGPGAVFTLSPFYHFNRAIFEGGPNDSPLIVQNDRASNYAGVQTSLAVIAGKHNARFGLYTYGQHDNSLFGLQANDGSGLALTQRQLQWGGLEAGFLEDQFAVTHWLTLNGGVRLTHYSGGLDENAASPRAGAAIRVPRLNWVLRGSYSRYYQAPPLDTVAGPLFAFALQQGFDFLPLHGERDEQWEAGMAIPFHGWTLDTDYFHTAARNFLDHDVLANSNIFFPLTIQRARIRGWESTLRSPKFFRRATLHAAFSHQFTEGAGAVTGGLTDFTPPDSGFFFLDHDQRNTFTTGAVFDLPGHAWASGNVAYGSGFLQGDGPAHLPPHTTLDLSLGKQFGERFFLNATALNLTNRRYQLDTSNTFGGTHWANPREFSVQLRWRFHY